MSKKKGDAEFKLLLEAAIRKRIERIPEDSWEVQLWRQAAAIEKMNKSTERALHDSRELLKILKKSDGRHG